jgi:hypothetical protein
MQFTLTTKNGRMASEQRPRPTELARRRRLNKLVRVLADDLGYDRVTVAERAALFQLAALNLQVELMQQAIVRGDQIENDELIRLSSEVRRLLNALRRRSAQLQAAPTLDQYLAQRTTEGAGA